MRTLDRLCATVYLATLGVWAGIIAMTAGAAAVTFPTVKALDPVVPTLDPASRPNWLYVAGKVASNVFRVSNAAQFTCAALVLVALFVLLRSPEQGRRLRRSVSLYASAFALLLISAYAFVLWPRMRANLHTYWESLNAGRLDAARTAQLAFDADHPTSSALFQVLLATLLIAAVTGVWNALRPRTTQP